MHGLDDDEDDDDLDEDDDAIDAVEDEKRLMFWGEVGVKAGLDYIRV